MNNFIISLYGSSENFLLPTENSNAVKNSAISSAVKNSANSNVVQNSGNSTAKTIFISADPHPAEMPVKLMTNLSNGRMKDQSAVDKEMVGGCCVCGEQDGTKDNPLVYCDGEKCPVAVHQGNFLSFSLILSNFYLKSKFI